MMPVTRKRRNRKTGRLGDEASRLRGIGTVGLISKLATTGLWSDVETSGTDARETCVSRRARDGIDLWSTRSQYDGMRLGPLRPVGTPSAGRVQRARASRPYGLDRAPRRGATQSKVRDAPRRSA
eukprot:5386373-Pleurochrysis_carterae.AAC.1